jgi:hypothetical protein
VSGDLERSEWLFPVRGRWLVRLLQVGRVVGLLLLFQYWIGLREVLPTLDRVHRQQVSFGMDSRLEFGARCDNFWQASHCGYHISVGPARIMWVAPLWRDPVAEGNIRALVDFCGALIAGGVILALARAGRRNGHTPTTTVAGTAGRATGA